MADPISFGLALKAGADVAGGIAGMQEARGEQQRAEINAYIGETRAIQTDTMHRRNLETELGEIRAAFGANGQRMISGNLDLMNEAREIRNRDRRINTANERRTAMDWQIAGRNAAARGRGALFAGVGSAAPSLFDLIG